MDAKPLSLGKIVSERQRFVVPIYQRNYTWTVKDQLEPLFDQVEDKASERITEGSVQFSHYMGALLLIPDSDPVFGRIQTFNIVDGQQRLTTFHLCFAALRDVARHHGGNSIASQLSDLVVHGDAVPMTDRKTERYKLQPTSYDRALFRDLVDLNRDELTKKFLIHFHKNGTIKRATAPLPLAAYWYFWERADAFVTQDGKDASEIQKRLLALSTVLFEDFRLIVITLAKDDDAQVIFQTLNSGGKPLAAMDLVRNDVFHRASRANEDEQLLMDQYWAVFEDAFWKAEQTQGRIKKPRMDFFLAHTLAAEQGKLISLGELYSEYKSFVNTRKFPNSAAELTVLTRHVSTYRNLIEPSDGSPLRQLAMRLNVFDVSTAYPAILVIAAAEIDDDLKAKLYGFLAGYVCRRALCHMTPKNYNNVFVELAANLRQNGVSIEVFKAFFSSKMESVASHFPSDEEVTKAFRTMPQYGSIPQNRLRLILEELEFASRNKFNIQGSLQEGLTIEHVMPQEWREKWPLQNGQILLDKRSGADEALRREIEFRDSLVQTIGNLTLLTPPANSSAGNSSFEAKRARLLDSLLNTNAAILQETIWNETAILKRADTLALLACKLWPTPV